MTFSVIGTSGALLSSSLCSVPFECSADSAGEADEPAEASLSAGAPGPHAASSARASIRSARKSAVFFIVMSQGTDMSLPCVPFFVFRCEMQSVFWDVKRTRRVQHGKNEDSDVGECRQRHRISTQRRARIDRQDDFQNENRKFDDQ